LSNDTIELTIDTRELDRALQAMPARLAKAIMSGALQAGGDVMLEAVVAHTPERTDEENPESTSLGPGILKADMHTEVQFSRKYGTARVKVGPSRAIGGLVAYRVNNGWTLSGHGKSPRKIRSMPGKHFLEAAFDESAQLAIDTFIDELGNSLGFGENAGPENNSHDVEFG
jgi:hypothetical protein